MVDSAQSTVVGPSILISGNLQGDEDLTVLGRVEGSLTLTKTLNVEESGIVKAEISVRNAIVSGVVVGNITATDSVEITEAGRMVGDINAPRVIIVDGARFRGAVDMGDLEAPRASAPLPARTVDRSSISRTMPMSRPMPSARTTPSAPPTRRPPPPPPPPPRQERPATTGAPVAAKKKLKKKVVVKKKKRG
jgi:cytoskeletal protein CcmA (bactofilin family)